MNKTTHAKALRAAKKMLDAQYKADKAEKELATLYEPELAALIKAGEWPAAFQLISEMPACVTRVFFVDRIRHARGDFNK